MRLWRLPITLKPIGLCILLIHVLTFLIIWCKATIRTMHEPKTCPVWVLVGENTVDRSSRLQSGFTENWPWLSFLGLLLLDWKRNLWYDYITHLAKFVWLVKFLHHFLSRFHMRILMRTVYLLSVWLECHAFTTVLR